MKCTFQYPQEDRTRSFSTITAYTALSNVSQKEPAESSCLGGWLCIFQALLCPFFIFFVSVTQTFHNVALCNPCLLILHKFSLVSHHAQAPKPTHPTCTPPQGLVLVGAPRLRSHKENDRQTELPTEARSMQHGQCSHQARSLCSASTLHLSSKRVMQGQAASSPDVTAARRLRHHGAPLQEAQN